jgi:20S proteasome subunit alpha 2
VSPSVQPALLGSNLLNTPETSFSNRGVRPYGVSLLIAGWDAHRGQSLYQVDPSGSFWAWKASAIGKNMSNGKTFLEKRCVRLGTKIRHRPLVLTLPA